MAKKKPNIYPPIGCITFADMAKRVGVSYLTLRNWYKWYHECKNKPRETPRLPKAMTSPSGKFKYFHKQSYRSFKRFQTWLHSGNEGVLVKYSEVFWTKEQKERKARNIENRRRKKGFITKRDKPHHILNAYGKAICGNGSKNYIYFHELPKHKGQVKICHWCLLKLGMNPEEINKGIRKVRTDTGKKRKKKEEVEQKWQEEI